MAAPLTPRMSNYAVVKSSGRISAKLRSWALWRRGIARKLRGNEQSLLSVASSLRNVENCRSSDTGCRQNLAGLVLLIPVHHHYCQALLQ